MKQVLVLIMLLLTSAVSNVKSQSAGQLEEAYQQQSTQKLKTFLDEWAKELKPATNQQRKKMSKTVQQAYAVFEAFYNPHDLASRGSTQWGNDIYTGYNYLIIQNGFKIFQKDKVYYTEEEAKANTIDNILKNVEEKYHERWIASIGVQLISMKRIWRQ